MHRPVYRFRNFRLDAAARELWHGDERVALPLKSFECLAYLVEHRDRAVGRDELIAAVWGRAEVSDTLLGQTLLRSRRAVDDVGEERTTVRTVTRFGYRWVAPVEVEDASVEPESAVAVESEAQLRQTGIPAPRVAVRADEPVHGDLVESAPSRSTRVPVAFAIGALFAIVVTLAIFATASRFRKQPAQSSPPAAQHVGNLVLVLPVAGVDPAGEESWVRLGAMEYLASRLHGAQELQILPSEQTVALLGRDGAADQRGASDLYRFEQTTGASYILAPHAAHIGSRWNLTLDVYHDRGTHSFEAQAATPLEATAEVANRFLESLGLTGKPLAAVASTPTAYLQRIDAAMLAGDLDHARRLADAAPADLKSDPAFTVRAGRIAFRSGKIDQAEQLLQPLSRENASLPPEIRARALLGLAAIAFYRQDFETAERYYTATIAAIGERGDPEILGKAYMERGVVHGVYQRIDAAMADFGRARVELERAGDHLGAGNLDTNLGLVESLRNRYTEALAAYDRAVAVFTRFGVNDNLAIALQGKTYVQRMLLDLDGALVSSQRETELSPHLENPTLRRRIAMSRVPVLLAVGRLNEAADAISPYVAADDSAKAVGDPAFAVLHAKLLVEQNKFADALRGADAVLEAIELQSNQSSETYLSEAVEVYVDAALRSGQIEQARHFLERLRSSTATPQDDNRALILELCIARVLAAGNDTGAVAHFKKALVLADGSGADNIVIANAAYARYLLGHHDMQDATAVLGRLVPYADRDYRAARVVAALYTALGDHDLAGQASASAQRLAGERPPQPL